MFRRWPLTSTHHVILYAGYGMHMDRTIMVSHTHFKNNIRLVLIFKRGKPKKTMKKVSNSNTYRRSYCSLPILSTSTTNDLTVFSLRMQIYGRLLLQAPLERKQCLWRESTYVDHGCSGPKLILQWDRTYVRRHRYRRLMELNSGKFFMYVGKELNLHSSVGMRPYSVRTSTQVQ